MMKIREVMNLQQRRRESDERNRLLGVEGTNPSVRKICAQVWKRDEDKPGAPVF